MRDGWNGIMLLLIDNYDSFVHNLARYFVRLGCDVRVARNDTLSVAEVERLGPQAIVISPGPCTPREAGCSMQMVSRFHDRLPILGICLGHQAIITALGGRLVRCEPMHGRTSLVCHDGRGVFEGVPNPMQACRYHSLAADPSSLPNDVQVCGESDGVIMAIRHRRFPVVGVQFHPEAVLTEFGYPLLANFLRLARIDWRQALPTMDDELARAVRPANPGRPPVVTF